MLLPLKRGVIPQKKSKRKETRLSPLMSSPLMPFAALYKTKVKEARIPTLLSSLAMVFPKPKAWAWRFYEFAQPSNEDIPI